MLYIWIIFCSGIPYCLELSIASNSHAASKNLLSAWLPSEIFPKYVNVRKGEKVRRMKEQEFYVQTQFNVHYLSIDNSANFIEFEIV